MTRLMLALIIYTILARWIYSEVKLVAPGAAPAIDSIMEALTIPTHDHWLNEHWSRELIAKISASAEKHATNKLSNDVNLSVADSASIAEAETRAETKDSRPTSSRSEYNRAP